MALPYVAVVVGLDMARSGVLAYALYNAGMAVVLWKAGWLSRARQLLLGWEGRIGGALLLGAVLAVGAVLVTWPAWIELVVLRARLAAIGLEGTAWTALVWYHALANPWLEELYWRGLLADGRRGVSKGDIAFAGYHVLVLRHFITPGWQLTIFLLLVLTAWIWRRASRQVGGLLPAVVSHAVGGGGALLAMAALLRGLP